MANITVSDLTINQEQESFLQELKDSEIAEVKGGWITIAIRIIIKIKKK